MSLRWSEVRFPGVSLRFVGGTLSCFENLPGLEASGADFDPADGAADKSAHALEIWLESPFGPVVRV